MLARWTRGVSRDEWLRLSGFGAAVLALHVVGWGLFLYFSGHYRPLVGLGLTAYLFGLRHAFDADHIAAIDNTHASSSPRASGPSASGSSSRSAIPRSSSRSSWPSPWARAR